MTLCPRHSHVRILALVTFALVALTACGAEEDDSDPVAPSVSSDPLTAHDAVLTALCQANARCNFGFAPASIARCKAYLEAQYVLSGPSLPGGAVSVDTAQLATCLDAFENLSCAEGDRVFYDDYGFVQYVCPKAFVGTVAEGETCYNDPECAPGLRCVSGDACPGVCERTGVPCPGEIDGPPGPDDLLCPRETWCDAEAVACRPLKPAGEACAFDRECEINHSCDEGVCVLDPDVGESCASTGICQQHAHCTEEGICELDAWGAAEGQPCGGGSNCGNGLFCTGEFAETGEGVCAPVSEVGEPCDDMQRCAPDLFCNVGTCREPLEPGQACSGLLFNECRLGFCDDNVCVAIEERLCVRPAP